MSISPDFRILCANHPTIEVELPTSVEAFPDEGITYPKRAEAAGCIEIRGDHFWNHDAGLKKSDSRFQSIRHLSGVQGAMER